MADYIPPRRPVPPRPPIRPIPQPPTRPQIRPQTTLANPENESELNKDGIREIETSQSTDALPEIERRQNATSVTAQPASQPENSAAPAPNDSLQQNLAALKATQPQESIQTEIAKTSKKIDKKQEKQTIKPAKTDVARKKKERKPKNVSAIFMSIGGGLCLLGGIVCMCLIFIL